MTFPVRTEPGAKDHEMVKITSLEQIHLLSKPTLLRRSLIKSSLIMSAGRDSIVSIVASDDMFPISWIIPAWEHHTDQLSQSRDVPE